MADELEELKKKYSMFMPKSARHILEDYPELKKVKAFDKLTNSEMKFVWFFACKVSPFFMISDPRERAENAYMNSFREEDMFGSHKEKFLSGGFPEKVSIAIEQMVKYEPGPRIRAKIMVEKIISNFEEIVHVTAEDKKQWQNKEGIVDWSKKKAYIDSCAKVQSELPGLIAMAEGSFGIEEDEDEDEFNDGSLLDEFHNYE